MSDRTKTGWSIATVISLLGLIALVSASLLKGGAHLGSISTGVDRLIIGQERIEEQLRTHEARISALERHKQILEDLNTQRLQGYRFANPEK